MRKKRFLSLLLAAVMTAAAALTLFSCKESEGSADYALKYNVNGTWYAEYDAEGVVGGGQMEYNRLITACTFNDDGTGTWYKLMLTNDSGDPIAIDGGAGHGDFTYSVGADGKITCKLNWNQAPAYYPKTIALAVSDTIISGSEGGIQYTMSHASDAMKQWIADWDQQLNGGGNLSPTSFNANADFTASNWRTEEWIYIYDGVGTSHPTEKGFTIVALPWNTEHSKGTLQTNLPEGFCNDITPENGWELVLNLCGNSIIGGVKNNNFFALYNKYLGILRFFYFMPADFEAGNDHVWQVSMSENLGQHSLYGYGVPSDFTFTNKAFIGQSGVGYMEYVTPWVDYKSSDGLIVPNAGWWAFDVDLSTYRSNANYNGDNIKLQMRSWDITHTSLYSTLTAGIEGTIKANMELYQAAKKSSAGSSARGVLMGLQAAAQAGSTVTSFCTGNWAAGLTSMGQMFGTGASLAGLGGDGGGAANYKLNGTISLGMSGDMNTAGVISGSKATVGIPSPTISLNDFDPKNSHVGQGVWNLKKAPVVYRTRHVAFDTWTYSYTGKWCCFVSRPYFFDPSSIEVELNPDVFPESQIEWMEVDAICGATADKQCQPPSVTNFSGNVAWRDAYGLVTPGLERYWADLVDKSMLKVVENRKNSIWDFLYNMNDKYGMDALHTVFKFEEDITIADTKIQGRGKNGFAIEPQITGAFKFNGSQLYIPYFFLEVNVKVKVKMRGMENPIVLSRNYLPDYKDYGDGSEFDKSRKHSRPYQSKMSGHTDLYDYQMKRIDDIIKLCRSPKVGDLYYSDGTYSETLEPGKTPIGVVAYVDDPKTTADDEVVEKGHGGGHGLVLCLKNAASHVKWSTEKVTKFSGQLVTDVAGLKRLNNVSGYSYTATMAADAAKYPAAAAAKNYKGLPAPAGTTGWFLPSAQQWVKMIEGLGGLDESAITLASWFGKNTAVDKWEAALKKAGTSNYDSMTPELYYLTSSEYSPGTCITLNVHTTGYVNNFCFRIDYKDFSSESFRVRPILAF